MSTNILKIIPAIPTVILEETDIFSGKIFLSNLLNVDVDEIKFRRTKNVHFIDPGTNLYQVRCPFCGSEIKEDWWQDSMDYAFKIDNKDLTIQTPCCNKEISLNDLNYDQPTGFALDSFVIEDPERNLTENEIIELGNLLKTKIRMIWGHY